MKTAKIMLAGAAALTIISSAALAQETKQGSRQESQQQSQQDSQTGTITKIDRINGTIAIQQEQSGTVGASTGSAGEEFKAQRGVSLDDVHAGDKVTYSTTGAGGIRTITKLQKQKE